MIATFLQLISFTVAKANVCLKKKKKQTVPDSDTTNHSQSRLWLGLGNQSAFVS